MWNMQYDYPPEWDEDEASLHEKDDDDFDPPDYDYDDPKDAYERMTDLEIRYNRGY